MIQTFPGTFFTLWQTQYCMEDWCIFFLEIKTLILEQFKARGKTEGKAQSYPVYFPFLQGMASPTVVTPLRVVHLLQLMDLPWPHNHPKFTVSIWVTPGMPSMALKKCIMTCSHHHYITQSNFIALKICALPAPPSLLLNWQLLIFYCLHSLIFSRTSYALYSIQVFHSDFFHLGRCI